MNPVATSESLRLLFDWAHDSGRRLALWILAALALHAAAYVIFRVSYPRPEPARISEATLYVLPPGSPEIRRLEPFLASADPALFAAERRVNLGLPSPGVPPYEPSYAAARPDLLPLPDPQPRILPPLPRDIGPVPVVDSPPNRPALPAPATLTKVEFSADLRPRAPAELPKARFIARPGDQLPPLRFLLAVAPDGRVLHVIPDIDPKNAALVDAASRQLMQVWFERGNTDRITWGTATFSWGLDVRREEPRDSQSAAPAP